jgi:hypothetical protein
MTMRRVGLTLAMIVCAAAAGATPTPPTPVSVTVSVQTVGPQGLLPAANVQADVCFCYDPPSCLDSCDYIVSSGITGTDGILSASFYQPGGGLFVGLATVNGTSLRSFAAPQYYSLSIVIDPISEAAVELLAGHPYSTNQLLGLFDRIRQANAHTDFAGVSVADAIVLARTVAAADPAVQAALPTWTPTETPTATPTRTPTPTRTLRPTGTPRACIGDCTADGHVDIYELVTAVDLALGYTSVADCSAGYANAQPDVADIIIAVNNALYGCQPSPALPDLVPVSVAFASGPSCISYYSNSYCFNVCIANVGDNAASAFTVSIGAGPASTTLRVYGLVAGDGECDLVCNVAFAGSVLVDSGNEVTESREDNNVAPYRISTPTPPPRCPTPTPT